MAHTGDTYAHELVGLCTEEQENARLANLKLAFDGDGRLGGVNYSSLNFSTSTWNVLAETTTIPARRECESLVQSPDLDASFWLPANAEPSSLLEVMAQAIFLAHSRGAAYDPGTSG